MKVVAAVLLLVAAASAQYGGYGHGHAAIAVAKQPVDYFAPPHYNFEYSVHDAHTGDQKSQSESREGDVVHGQYSLVEPDGTVRTVEYTADDHNGFNAVVHRQGHAGHPAQVIQKAVVAPVIQKAVVAAPVAVAAAPVAIAGRGYGYGGYGRGIGGGLAGGFARGGYGGYGGYGYGGYGYHG